MSGSKKSVSKLYICHFEPACFCRQAGSIRHSSIYYILRQLLDYFFFQLSLKVTVLLNTSLSSVESLSTQK